MERSSTTWRDDCFERSQFGSPRSRVSRQPTGDLDAVVGVDETTLSSTNEPKWKNVQQRTYFHRINSMVMMNELAFEDKPHRSDEPNLRTLESSEIPQSSVQVQTPLGISTYETENMQETAKHCRSENYSGSGHFVIPACNDLRAEHLQAKEGKDNIHLWTACPTRPSTLREKPSSAKVGNCINSSQRTEQSSLRKNRYCGGGNFMVKHKEQSPGTYPRVEKQGCREKLRAVSQRCGTSIRESPRKQ